MNRMKSDDGKFIAVPLVNDNLEPRFGHEVHPELVWVEVDSIYAKQGYWLWSEWFEFDVRRRLKKE